MARKIKVKSRYFAPSTGYFEIDNGKSVYKLIDKMTPEMTQDELAEFYNIEKQKGNPVPMNAPQHIELFDDAVKSGNAELLNFLKKGLQRRWPTTLSRAVYSPVNTENGAIHNYGTFDSYFNAGNLIGKDGFITEIDNKNSLEILAETKNVKRLNKISDAMNQTPMYLWRVNSKPSERTERVVGFFAYNDWLGLDAVRILSDKDFAFLVEKVK